MDSWDLLYPHTDTHIGRNKKSVQVFNSISSGYYPAFGALYKSHYPTHNRPLIQVTVYPKSSTTISNSQKRKRRHTKKIPENTEHSERVYLVIPGNKRDNKAYVVDTTNAEILKEINDNKLLSKCIIRSYFKDMHKTRKKISDKSKESENPSTSVPECSPGCAYRNITNKTNNASPDRSGSASAKSSLRSSYNIETKLESTMNNKTLSTTQRQTSPSPERNSLKNYDRKPKSPIRSNQQTEKTKIYESEKNRKDETIKSPDRGSESGKRSIDSILAEEKRRSPERHEKRDLDSRSPGRIRITGRLGITQDDKCVLKCDATLNDKPIPTQFQGAECAMLPLCYQACNEEFRTSRKQRDVKVQAKGTLGARCCACSTTGKESQATQVDFQMVYTTPTTPAARRRAECSRGKVMQQCACINTVDARDMYDTKENKGTVLKKHHSPLIVISVYSRNEDSSENNSELNAKRTKTTEHKKDNKKIVRSRSPSPAKNSKKVIEKKSESRVNASTSKKTVRETARKSTRSKLNQTQSRVVRSTSAKTKTELRTTKSKSSKAKKTPPQSRRSNSPQIKQEEVNITEQMKRALIDDFTKKYTEQITQRNAHLDIPLQTKHDVSNITIDIEGDSAYYNVKLEQDAGKLNTELTVRKPPRGPRTGEVVMGETDTTSLENFLYMPENEHRKRSFSQTLMFDGTSLTMDSAHESGTELNVKDSIEVSHRRETKASVNGYRERNDITKEVDSNNLDQTKHFPGDECLIPNPVTRDREIQKLLGIDRGVNKSKSKPSQPSSLVQKRSQVRSLHENNSNTVLIKNTKTDIVTKTFATNCLCDDPNTGTLIPPLEMDGDKNVQLFCHLSLHKSKPIGLTRRQYYKVKRTIYRSLVAKHNLYLAKYYYNDRRLNDYKLNFINDGTKNIILHYNKNCQTDKNGLMDQICATSDVDTYVISETNLDANSMCNNENSKIRFSSVTTEYSSNANSAQQMINGNNYYAHNVLRSIYIAREQISSINEIIKKEPLIKTGSVKNIYLRKMSMRKLRLRFSSSDSANYISTAQECQDAERKKSGSIHTIFKCHQKSITPNLGTSHFSLFNCSQNNDSRFKCFNDSTQDIKPSRKPFLQRLISCLAFKFSPTSQSKTPRLLLGIVSPTSSFDSYHISTSLGAIEMSSSLYDTSASFYSDHTVPSSKMKHGFLSSVRGFLTRKYC